MKKIISLCIFIICFVTFNAQTIQNVTPNNVGPHQQLTVSITGQNTNFTSGTSLVQLKYYITGSSTGVLEIDGTNITVNSDTDMTVDLDFNTTQTGNWDVEVTTVTDGLIFMDDGIFVNSPSLSPSIPSASQGETLTVGVIGQYTAFDPGATNISFYQNGSATYSIDGTNIVVNSMLSADADFSIPGNAPIGMYNMQAEYQGYTTVTSNVFEVLANPGAMAINSVSPYSVLDGDSVVFNVQGQNFPSFFNEAYFYTNSDTIHADVINVISGAEISLGVSIPVGASGVYGLKVVNDSVANYFNAISITNNPANDILLTDFSADTLHFDDSLTVTITGQNTTFTNGVNYVRLHYMASSTVFIDGVNIVVANDSTLLTDFNMSVLPVGAYSLEVNQPSGSLYLSNATFIVPPDDSTGSVSGYITSFLKSGYTVNLHNSSMTILESTTTDINDYFQFTNLGWGTYYLTVDQAPLADPFEVVLAYNDNVFMSADFVITQSGDFGILTIEENEMSHFKVFPNPTNGKVLLEFENSNNEEANIIVTDLNGRTIFNHFLLGNQSSCQIDLTGASSGMYFINLTIGNKVQSSKLIIE